MVFYYTIRGGQCLNEHSHITLSEEDIICYVGRDKHENEYLIQYGWPGDIWFHVDGLSSAHVYFRLKNMDTVSSIPLDDLPTDSVYDMMQICKHNSISGCKLASCKMVYTPHSNLKKTFDMESGSVTYHDTKLSRYARCEKDRQRVKELEKTKTTDRKVDYYQQMKDNERSIIDRKKRLRQQKKKSSGEEDDGMYDPIRDDMQSTKIKSTRQGDKQSGIDTGLSALEGLSFAPISSSFVPTVPTIDTTTADAVAEEEEEDDDPIWMREENDRGLEPSDDVRFLRERGYQAEESIAAIRTNPNARIQALQQLYNHSSSTTTASTLDCVPDEDVIQARLDEKEVLLAMFGGDEDDDDDGNVEEGVAVFANAKDENSLDVALPISSYEPPDRYEMPPPLMMEVYVDHTIAPLYPYHNNHPVLALYGGGFTESQLKYLTTQLRTEVSTRMEEEPGEPQIFNLITYLADEAEAMVQQETAEIEAEIRLVKQERAAAKSLIYKQEAEKRKKEAAEQGYATTSASFKNELERNDYAKSILAKGAYVKNDNNNDDDDDGIPAKPKGRKQYDSGISNASLIDDLFS